MAKIQKEIYCHFPLIKKNCNLNEEFYRKIVNIDERAEETEQGYPIFGLLAACVEIIRKSGAIKTKNEKESVSTTAALADENLIKLKIFNQTKLGMLMPKREVTMRILRLLTGVKNAQEHGIQLATHQLAVKYNLPKVEVGTLLTTQFTQATNYLVENAEQLSWAEDGAVNVVATRMMSLAEEEDRIEREIERDLEDIDMERDIEYEDVLPSFIPDDPDEDPFYE